MLCSHVLRVMEILYLEDIRAKHILKRLTKDARDILHQHLVQYQRDNSVNLSFTCRHSTLYPKAMEVVRMRDASAAAFDHVFAGLDALLLSGAPFAEKRDGYGFEDHMAGLTPGTLPGNGEIAYVGDKGADRCISTRNSIRANGLHCLTVLEKQRGVGRPTNNSEKAPYKGLSKRTRFCSICRRGSHNRLHTPKEGMPQRNHLSSGDAGIVEWKGPADNAHKTFGCC
ncbi:uncharacterized protein [Triticum aestivum]|uniref:Protein FAR1-RELATED SEQUENCE n=3 Tax=Aegilops tauschii subsp. strangulata TaxID=200361 RepID=A0A453IQF9_AEGTS|nr:uncharacterized protein LOC123098368 [Triticum aestivum]